MISVAFTVDFLRRVKAKLFECEKLAIVSYKFEIQKFEYCLVSAMIRRDKFALISLPASEFDCEV